jgi:uncharacterized protein
MHSPRLYVVTWPCLALPTLGALPVDPKVIINGAFRVTKLSNAPSHLFPCKREGQRLNTAATPPVESLIEYPSRFPIKVMGYKVEGFVHAVAVVAKHFDPEFDASTIELRESTGGKYLGITVTITATSREQLDELYRTLSTHPMVKVVL